MTAKFPASIATTADLGQPNASDMLDSPDHASLHRQITDEIIAIETALGVGLANAGGVTGFANLAAFPATGVVNKVYLALDTGKMYRWDTGTAAYVAIGGGGTVAGVLHYDGAKDVTAPLGAYAPTQGATITASAAGAVNASWPGAAGQTVSIGDVLMFDGTNWHVQAGIADVDLMVRKTDVLAGAGMHDLTAALTGITPVANMVVQASKAGTAHASWAGITGTVNAGAVYQYNGTAWVAVDQTKVPAVGASDLMYVNSAGDTMYGPLMIDFGKIPTALPEVYANIGGTEIRGSNAAAGNRSVIIGAQAMQSASGVSGGSVIVGEQAGQRISSGGGNVLVGFRAGQVLDSGISNVFVGRQAGAKNTGGSGNTAIGNGCLIETVDGGANTAIGSSAGPSNRSGSNNSFFGAYAGYANIDGLSNGFYGYRSGPSSKNGNFNNFIGQYSGLTNISGSNKVSIGHYAGGVSDNSAARTLSGASTWAGPWDLASVYNITAGATIDGLNLTYDVFIPTKTNHVLGAQPGRTITLTRYRGHQSSAFTTEIGAYATAVFDNSTAIGANSITDKANQVVLGDNTVTEVKTHGLYVGTVGGVSQRMIGLQELKTIVAASADFNAFKTAIAAL